MTTKNFMAADGQTYQINLDDECIEVRLDGERMGSISLTLVEMDRYSRDYYYITNLDLAKCKGLGIGRACLQFHREEIGEAIYAADEYGQKMDDGSHLIDDGIPFIAKMREEGIVVKRSED
ncbi:hypothetical protein [Citrobacter portucalensis]|uniref:hypothetical protein n=1 Tax=Citrobacter portucalensis TaxID=1639133 RepID=UPI002B227459|nr:hypothetical protein [Citrobacter portucalensis]MEB0898604.1 hypothetical protein [Citrobacter portucalensis]